MKSSIDLDKQTSSDWINTMWVISSSTLNFIEHLTLIGDFKPELNPVLWSLVHEMRISIIFPFIMLVVIKYDWKKIFLLSLFLSFSGFVLGKFLGTNYFVTLHYSSMFILGSLLAKNKNYLITLFRNLNIGLKLILLIVSVHLYTYRWLFYGNDLIHHRIVDEWAASIGVCLILILILSSELGSSLLTKKPIIFIGKISYSLYLFHLIFLLFFMKTLNSVPLALFITAIVSIGFSTASYYILEKGSIKWGRYLATITSTRKKVRKKVA